MRVRVPSLEAHHGITRLRNYLVSARRSDHPAPAELGTPALPLRSDVDLPGTSCWPVNEVAKVGKNEFAEPNEAVHSRIQCLPTPAAEYICYGCRARFGETYVGEVEPGRCDD